MKFMILLVVIFLTSFEASQRVRFKKGRIYVAKKKPLKTRRSEDFGTDLDPTDTAFEYMLNVFDKMGRYRQPSVILIMGTVGSGKTTLAKYLTRITNLTIRFHGSLPYVDDYENDIGHTGAPKTIVPKYYRLFRNSTKESAYILDCPGFAESIHEFFDVVSKFYLDITIQRLVYVKIILTITFSELRNNGVKVLRQIAAFLSNETLYSNSVGLVVTKILSPKRHYDPSYDVKGYLLKTKKLLRKNEAARHLINKLLAGKAIGYMMNLDTSIVKDYVDPISLLMLQKLEYARLNDEEDNYLKNASVKSIHFDFTLHESSSSHQTLLIKKITRSFGDVMSEIKESMFKHYDKKMRTITDFVRARLLFDAYYLDYNEQYEVVIDGLEKGFSYSMSSFLYMVKVLRITLPRRVYLNLVTHYRCLTFLSLYSVHDINIEYQHFIREFKELADYLKFTSAFYEILSKYSYKALLIANKKAEKNETCVSGHCSNYKMMDTNMNIFIFLRELLEQYEMQLTDHFLERLASLQPAHLFQIKEQKYFISKQEVKIVCEVMEDLDAASVNRSQVLRVTGFDVKFSEIAVSRNFCDSNDSLLQHIEIFALNTVYLDKDMRDIFPMIGDNLSLYEDYYDVSIVAPNWIVDPDKQVHIKLDGAPGRDTQNDDSLNGYPGHPGYAAGPFEGVADNIENARNLIISSRGGHGGAATDGSRGTDGRNGEDSCPENWTCPRGYLSLTAGRFKMWTGSRCMFMDRGTNGVLDAVIAFLVLIAGIFLSVFKGCEGRNGTDGGHGGMGGFGGHGNEIIILNFNSTFDEEVITKNNDGHQGTGGKGAFGGIGGINENSYFGAFNFFFNYLPMFRLPLCTWFDNSVCGYRHRAKYGAHGKDNFYTVNMVKAKNVTGFQEPYWPVINFKKFARENLINKIHKKKILNFYSKLEKGVDMEINYTIKGYCLEFLSLEKQYFELRDIIHYNSFYESLLLRINATCEDVNCTNLNTCPTIPKDNKTCTNFLNDVHDFLVGSIKTKRNMIRGTKKPDMTPNITHYIKRLKKHIKIYEKYRLSQIGRIETHKKILKACRKIFDIKKKIQITHDRVINMSKLFNVEFKKLVKEIDARIKKSREEMHKAVIRAIVAAITMVANVVLQVVGTIFPAARVVTDMLSKGLEYAKKGADYLLAKDENMEETPDTPVIQQNLKVEAAKEAERSKKADKSVIKMVEKEKDHLKEVKNDLHAFLGKIQDFSDQVDNMNEKIQQIEEQEANIQSLLDSPIASKLLGPMAKYSKKALAVVQKVGGKILQVAKNVGAQLAKVCGKVMPILGPLMTIFDGISEISAALKEADRLEKEIFRLQNLKDFLQGEFVPYLTDVKSQLFSAETHLDDLSDKDTDSSVDDDMNVLEYKLAEATESFKCQKTVTNTFAELKDAMVDQLNFYSELRDSQDDVGEANHKLEGYLVDPAPDKYSEKLKYIPVYYKEIVFDLKTAARANLILTKYSIAVKAIKRAAFPFVEDDVKEFALDHFPNCTRVNLQGDLCIKSIKNEVDDFDDILDEHDKKVNIREVILKEALFLYDNDFTGPQITDQFFTWYNALYKEDILNLLQGNKIYIYADITQQDSEHEAIKFNRIGLRFSPIISANKTQLKTVKNFNSHLKDCSIDMIHLGDHYYLCSETYYLLRGEKLKFSHSMEVNTTLGFPTKFSKENKAYTELTGSYFQLSPYGHWILKMKCTDDGQTFLSDNPTVGEYVDMHLEGSAKYVTTGKCPNVQKYYKVANHLPSSNEKYSTETDL